MEDMIKIKSVSSLEKCFIDDDFESINEVSEITAFKNQNISYQLCVQREKKNCDQFLGGPYRKHFAIRLSGDLKDIANVSSVISIPSEYPCNFDHDSIYLRTKPGLFPDLIRPLHYVNSFSLVFDYIHTLWVDVKIPEAMQKGCYSLTVEICSPDFDKVYASNTIKVKVVNIKLPPQKLIHTEWFYTDCIANYYGVKVFSEMHWKLIENFLKTAVDNGINMILTPVFTPELDTYIGGERLTTQLLDISVNNDGKYIFGFEKLSKWIDMCLRIGVAYFEIPHVFTQWGAEHAPKIVAKVNGRDKKIFGWETDSNSKEYTNFLSLMIPSLVDFLKYKGVFSKTYFHVSDEPSLKHLDRYIRCKNVISPFVDEDHIIDALSRYDFYESGALKKPVPKISQLNTFIDKKVSGLWAYYCGDSGENITGRLFAMPLYRTRILGIQLWMNNIEGFLHWGFNFYNNQNSYNTVDPYLCSDGEMLAPSGDTYLVYPGDNGEALRSIRLNAIKEAMEDMRLLDLCEMVCGRKKTLEIINKTAGMNITFTDYPKSNDFFNDLKDRIICEIMQYQNVRSE